MITEEQAKELKVGDIVHFIWRPGLKCEEWKVKVAYHVWEGGWLIRLQRGNMGAGISQRRMAEWHLPGDCPPPSHLMRIEFWREWDGQKFDQCVISLDRLDALGQEIEEEIIGMLVRAAQMMKDGLPD